MRTIKFRGKRVDNNDWVYGYYWEFKGEHFIRSTKHNHTVDHVVQHETIGQLITLLNEKEVYEGDVYEFCFDYAYGGPKLVRQFVTLIYEPISDDKILGNIHDNPDLL